MPTTVTILAPAYNEEDVLPAFVAAITPIVGDDRELLIVDDGSTDRTAGALEALAAEYPVLRVVTHERNRGLGAALVTGFAAARGAVIVTMDADLSHPVDLVEPLVAACGDASAAFASRFVAGGGMVGVPVLRRWVSWLGNLAFRGLFFSPVRDLTTGFRAYRRDSVADLSITSNGFEVQFEIAIRLIAANERIVEIPLQLTTRAGGVSKMRYPALLPAYGRAVRQMLALRWFDRDSG